MREESHEVRPTFALVFCWSTFPVVCIPWSGYQEGQPVRAWWSPEFRAVEEADVGTAGHRGGGSCERGARKLRGVSVPVETCREQLLPGGKESGPGRVMQSGEKWRVLG